MLVKYILLVKHFNNGTQNSESYKNMGNNIQRIGWIQKIRICFQ